MVGWWPGDGNTSDLIAGNNGKLVGGASFAQGEVRQAFSLNGVGEYVDLGNPKALQVSSGDFTVDAWVNFASLQGDMSIVDKMSANNTDGWRLFKGADNYFYFCLGEASNACSYFYSGNDTARSVTQATAGTWFFIAAEKTSNYITIFVNGNAENTVVLAPFTDSNSTDVLVGSSIWEGAYLNGRIDEVEVFNDASPGIQAIYNAGTAGKCEMNGVDISRASGDVSDKSWQTMVGSGVLFGVVQAWGGLTQSAYAKDQLVGDGVNTKGAQGNGLLTAAYALLNYFDNSETGTYQVDEAFQAVGSGANNLKFMMVDVEPIPGESFQAWLPTHKYALSAKITDLASHIQKVVTAGTSGNSVPSWNDSGGTTIDGTVTWKDTGVLMLDRASRIERISEAVQEIQAKGLKAVIYTDRGSWKEITGNCNKGSSNNCSNLMALPLWDVEHKTFIGSDGLKHCGDGFPGLQWVQNEGPYPPMGWQTRSANQSDFGLSPKCNGNAIFGITVDDVDLDFFDPALFN
jgi:hypothetical protein